MQNPISEVAEGCVECGLCREECPFLQKHGLPKGIAEACRADGGPTWDIAFECSLCGLCTALCPLKLDPGGMCLQMRREATRAGTGEHPQHGVLVDYEKRGVSPRYSRHIFPPGCHTVFFPGCTLPGTRPGRVLQTLEHLQRTLPSMGIVLDCCAKPSHDLGREERFAFLFDELKSGLIAQGIRTVVTACPSCHRVFRDYGGELSVTTVYEFMREHGLPPRGKTEGSVSVHDPCAVRFETGLHEDVRHLIRAVGLTVCEMEHHCENTVCCGEGGAVGFLAPEFSRHWQAVRKKEAESRRIITYCAGCIQALQSRVPVSHLLDLLFEPRAAMEGRVRVSRAPFTYWNRIRLKSRLKKQMRGAALGRRGITPGG